MLTILPAILLNQQYCWQCCQQYCQQCCQQYCWSAILPAILLKNQHYCWQYCQQYWTRSYLNYCSRRCVDFIFSHLGMSCFPYEFLSKSSLILQFTKAIFILLKILEGAARYAGLLLAPAEGFGLRTRPFFAIRYCYVCFGPNFGNFWYQ